LLQFSDAGSVCKKLKVPKVVKSEDVWRNQLSADEFEVTRHAGTERAFSGKYGTCTTKGLFRCICCDNALFSSATKFEFRDRLAQFLAADCGGKCFATGRDLSYGMIRDAVSCTQLRRAFGSRIR